MSADLREAYGVLSDTAISVIAALEGRVQLADNELFVRQVEARAICNFVSNMSADYRKHNALAVHEDLVVACAKYGVQPEWFFTDDEGNVDEVGTRELRADVAHYRIMEGLE